eukprot:Em0004g1368a
MAICPSPSFVQAAGTQYCYQYVALDTDWFTANKTCQSRGDGASLLWITSETENTYVRNTFLTANNNQPFWIGLNDVKQDGIFQWALRAGGQYYEQPATFFAGGSTPGGNLPVLDCVEFTADGWVVNPLYCTGRLNFVCKQQMCNSSDGLKCVSTGSSLVGSNTSASTVAGSVIGVILFIVILVAILVVVLLWKFQNDKFYRYLCCCVYTKTQPAIHSLQQENQRLRQELAQQKLSMSGRFPQGGLSEETVGGGLMKNGIGSSLPPLKPQMTTDLGSSLNSSMSFSRPGGGRIAPMSPLPMTSIPPPTPGPRTSLPMLPPLISPLPPTMKVNTPVPPKVGLGLPPVGRSFPPLRSPLSPIAEKSPMSPPPGSLGQSITGSMLQFRPGVIGPLPGRVTPMGGPLKGPLPSIGMKVPPPAGQPLPPLGQPMPPIGQTVVGQGPVGQATTAEPAQIGQDSAEKEAQGKEQNHESSDSENEERGEK